MPDPEGVKGACPGDKDFWKNVERLMSEHGYSQEQALAVSYSECGEE
jgi:hypothetical protein